MGARGLEPPNLIIPFRGHGCDLNKNSLIIGCFEVGARGLEPPNLTDVNRAL